MATPADEAGPGPDAPDVEVSELPDDAPPAAGEDAVASLLVLPVLPAAPAVLASALPAVPVGPVPVPPVTPALLLEVSGVVPVAPVAPAVLPAGGAVSAEPAAPVRSGSSRPHPARAIPSTVPRMTALSGLTVRFMPLLQAYREPEPLVPPVPPAPELPEVPPAEPDEPMPPELPELPAEPELPEVAPPPEL